MLDHEKWRRAIRLGGDGVLLMWWRFSSWCSRRLTDGRVPSDMVEELAEIGDSKTRSKQLRALVEARLIAWHDPAEDSTEVRRGLAEPASRSRRDGDELVVVGYLKRNPSRAKVEQDLERKAQAQRDYELRKRTDASVANQGPIGVRPTRSDPGNVPPRPLPSPISSSTPPLAPARVAIPEPECAAHDATPLRRKSIFAPDDFEPKDIHRARCQELRFDVADLLRAFKAHEFNRGYSDWDRRFSAWIEKERVERETQHARAGPRRGCSRVVPNQPNAGVTGLEKATGY
jgi:hypothetical protein